MSDKQNPQESIQEYIRIIFLNENGRPLKLQQRNDEYNTTVDNGYEDLNLRKDSTKINLYRVFS